MADHHSEVGSEPAGEHGLIGYHAMSSSPSQESAPMPDPTPTARSGWEWQERIAELESQLAEAAERDQVRELEISSLRHELELRFAYNAVLEEKVAEQRARADQLLAHADYLQHHLEHLTSVFAAESASMSDAIRAESERANTEHHRANAEVAARHASEDLLARERARISYRLMQRLLAPISRRRTHG